MRIAVASNGLDVAPHFSNCLNFNCYTTQSYSIAASQNIPAEGLAPDETVDLLRRIDADTLLAADISPASAEALQDAGIEVVPGAQGNALEAAEAFLRTRASELDADAPAEDAESDG